MNEIGITSINGFHLSMEERFKMIRKAGFDSLLMWWGDDEMESKAERVKLAEKYNLSIENAHAPTENLNSLMNSSNLYDEIGFELFLNRAYNQGLKLRNNLEKKRRK